MGLIMKGPPSQGFPRHFPYDIIIYTYPEAKTLEKMQKVPLSPKKETINVQVQAVRGEKVGWLALHVRRASSIISC